MIRKVLGVVVFIVIGAGLFAAFWIGATVKEICDTFFGRNDWNNVVGGECGIVVFFTAVAFVHFMGAAYERANLQKLRCLYVICFAGSGTVLGASVFRAEVWVVLLVGLANACAGFGFGWLISAAVRARLRRLDRNASSATRRIRRAVTFTEDGACKQHVVRLWDDRLYRVSDIEKVCRGLGEYARTSSRLSETIEAELVGSLIQSFCLSFIVLLAGGVGIALFAIVDDRKIQAGRETAEGVLILEVILVTVFIHLILAARRVTLQQLSKMFPIRVVAENGMIAVQTPSHSIRAPLEKCCWHEGEIDEVMSLPKVYPRRRVIILEVRACGSEERGWASGVKIFCGWTPSMFRYWKGFLTITAEHLG